MKHFLLVFSAIIYMSFSANAQGLWDDDNNYDCHVYDQSAQLRIFRFRGEKAIYNSWTYEGNYWDATKFRNIFINWVKKNGAMNGSSINVVDNNFSGTYILTYVENYGDRVIYKSECQYPNLYGNQTSTYYYAFSKNMKRLYYHGGNSLAAARTKQDYLEEVSNLEQLAERARQHEIRRGNGQIYTNGGTQGGGNCNVPSGGSYNNGINSSSQSTTQRRKCGYCNNGREMIERSINVYTNGIKVNQKSCSECGRTYDANQWAHFHKQCSHCRGKGYIE